MCRGPVLLLLATEEAEGDVEEPPEEVVAGVWEGAADAEVTDGGAVADPGEVTPPELLIGVGAGVCCCGGGAGGGLSS